MYLRIETSRIIFIEVKYDFHESPYTFYVYLAVGFIVNSMLMNLPSGTYYFQRSYIILLTNGNVKMDT